MLVHLACFMPWDVLSCLDTCGCAGNRTPANQQQQALHSSTLLVQVLNCGRRMSGMCSQVRLSGWPTRLPLLLHISPPPCWQTCTALWVSLFMQLAGLQSPNFPVLHKWHEVAAMDYKVAARSRRLWSMFERWLSGTNGSSGGSKPLAIEMGRRSS